MTDTAPPDSRRRGAATTGARTAATAADAACGCCGYSTRGLTTLSCPECGSDLRRVGVIGAGGASRGGAWQWIEVAVFWTLALGLVAAALPPAVEQVVPLRRTYRNVLTLTSATANGRSYGIDAAATTWSAAPPVLGVTLSFTRSPGAPSRLLRYDARSGTFRDVASPQRRVPLNPTTLLGWINAGSTATPDPAQSAEATALVGHLLGSSRPYAMMPDPGRQTRTGTSQGVPPFAAIANSTIAQAQPPAGVYPALLAAILLAWLAGLGYLLTLRRRVGREG